MGKCIVIAPLYDGEEQAWLTPEPGDLLICADGGYDAAVRWGFTPMLTVGDFDSMPIDHVRQGEIIRLPVHKDDPDLAVCLAEGRRRGYRSFRMAGGIGGRLDHTLSNLQCLYDCALRGEEAWLADGCNRVTVLTPGDYVLPQMTGRKLSLLSYTETVTGVTVTGTEWPLDNATLVSHVPLGVSNEFVAEEARLSFRTGALAVIYAQDAPHRQK